VNDAVAEFTRIPKPKESEAQRLPKSGDFGYDSDNFRRQCSAGKTIFARSRHGKCTSAGEKTFMKTRQPMTFALCCLAAASLCLAGCGGEADAADAKDAATQDAAASDSAGAAEKIAASFVAAQQAGDEAPTGNWGTLRGKFIYGDTPPKPEKIVPTKDVEVCGQHEIVDESLVVGEGGGLANVFVSIYVPRTGKLTVHESYAETAQDEVALDNTQCRFEPRCVIVRTSQKLLVKNSDPVGHNTLVATESFNPIIEANGSLTHQFKLARNPYPVPVQCNIHPWMKAHLLIRDDPYATLSAADGAFEIKNIPAGTHEFVFWHERPALLGDLEAGKVKTDRRGRMKVAIPAGQIVDLGEIKIPAAALKEKF
jgi:hypothetical protein